MAEIEVELPDGTILVFPEGMSDEAMWAAADREWKRMNMSTGEDVARAGAGGLMRGTTSGLADIPANLVEGAHNLGAAGLDWLGDKLGKPYLNQMAVGMRDAGQMSPMGSARATEDVARMAAGDEAFDYKGDSRTARMVGTAAEFLPGAVATGGKSAILPAITGGFGSELAGEATEGTVFEPAARIAGGIIGGAGPGMVERAYRGIRAPMGQMTDDVVRQHLDDLRAQGVEPTAGQTTGSGWLQEAERTSRVGSALMDTEQLQFNRAVSRLLGEEVDRLTPSYIGNRLKVFGQGFDDFGRGVDVIPDQTVMSRFTAAARRYMDQMPDKDIPKILRTISKKLGDSYTKGTPLSAQDLHSWRMSLGDMVADNNGPVMKLAYAAREAIDDALETALRNAGRGADVTAMQELRVQYRNLLAVAKVLRSSGQEIARGNVSMPKLRNAIAQIYDRAYISGKAGEIGDLVRAAESITKDGPTVLANGVRRLQGMPEMVGSAAGATVGGVIGDGIAPVVAGAAGGAMVPSALNNLVSMPFMQQWLKNTLPGPATRSIGRDVGVTMPGLLGSIGAR